MRLGAAPSWFSVTTTGSIPFTVTVICADLGKAIRFSEKTALISPFILPEGVTVHQFCFLEAVQEELLNTVKIAEPAGAVTDCTCGVTERVGKAPAWVTVTTKGSRLATTTDR